MPSSHSSNIKVVVRVRPPNKHEVDMGSAVVVQPVDENMLIFDPAEKSSPDLFRVSDSDGFNGIAITS